MNESTFIRDLRTFNLGHQSISLMLMVEADDPGSATGLWGILILLQVFLGGFEILSIFKRKLRVFSLFFRCIKGKKEFFCELELYRRYSLSSNEDKAGLEETYCLTW